MGNRTILTTLIQQLLAIDRSILQNLAGSGKGSLRFEQPVAVAFSRQFRDNIYKKVILPQLSCEYDEKEQIPYILREYYWHKHFIHLRNNEQHAREVRDAFLRLELITDRYLYADGNEPKNYILGFTCTVIKSYLNPNIYHDGKYLLRPSMARTHPQTPRIQIAGELAPNIKLQIDLLITMNKTEQINKANIKDLLHLANILQQFREAIETIPYQGRLESKIAGTLWECYFADFYPFTRTPNNTPIYDYIFLLYGALLKLRDTVALHAEPGTKITEALHTITKYEAACRCIEHYFIATCKINPALLSTTTILSFLAKTKVESGWFLNHSQSFAMLEHLAAPSNNYEHITEIGPLAAQFYLINIIAASGSKALTLVEQPRYCDLRKVICDNLGSQEFGSIPGQRMTTSKILTLENLNTLKQLMCNNPTQ